MQKLFSWKKMEYYAVKKLLKKYSIWKKYSIFCEECLKSVCFFCFLSVFSVYLTKRKVRDLLYTQ